MIKGNSNSMHRQAASDAQASTAANHANKAASAPSSYTQSEVSSTGFPMGTDPQIHQMVMEAASDHANKADNC